MPRKLAVVGLAAVALLFASIALFAISHNHQAQAVQGDCGQATELCIDSITPEEGWTTGNKTVTITGKNFWNGYISNGLAVLLDGKNNLGTGDDNHSLSTSTWVDLATADGSQDGTLANFTYSDDSDWLNDALSFVQRSPGVRSDVVNFDSPLLPENDDFTLEVVAQARATNGVSVRLFSQAPNVSSANRFGLYLVNWAGTPFGANYQFVAMHNNNGTAAYVSSGIFNTNKNSFTVVREGTTGMMYANGNLHNTTSGAFSAGILQTNSNLGNYGNNDGLEGVIYATRVYNRALTAAEIAHNASVDAKRFISPVADPPVALDTVSVTLGDETCSNVVVLSDTSLTCTTPAHAEGAVDVTVSLNGETATLESSFEYIAQYLSVTFDSDGIIDLNLGPSSQTTGQEAFSVQVFTNIESGYSIYLTAADNGTNVTANPIANNNLICSENSDFLFSPVILSTPGTPTALTAGTWGYSLTGAEYSWLPTPLAVSNTITDNTPIFTYSSAAPLPSGNITDIYFGAKVDYSTPVCESYAGTVVVTVVAGL